MSSFPWIDLRLLVFRFPLQSTLNVKGRVPSLLYYDKNGDVRAAGAEVLAESVVEAALTEGWTKVEWLVADDVGIHAHP